MKKRLRLLAWMLTLTMLCELLPFGAFAQSDVGQQLTLAAAQSLEEENGEATIIGKCGDNLQWSLSSDGVLTIDGTGKCLIIIPFLPTIFLPGIITPILQPLL